MSSSKSLFLVKALAGAALCFGSIPAVAGPACGLSLQGCVLPAQDAVPVAQATVAGPIEVEEPKGFPWLALLGVAAAGVAAFLLFADLDDDAEPLSP
jgi:hypothetical protein